MSRIQSRIRVEESIIENLNQNADFENPRFGVICFTFLKFRENKGSETTSIDKVQVVSSKTDKKVPT